MMEARTKRETARGNLKYTIKHQIMHNNATTDMTEALDLLRSTAGLCDAPEVAGIKSPM